MILNETMLLLTDQVMKVKEVKLLSEYFASV